MSESNQLVDRYLAVWHEADAEHRRRSIAELWVEDGVHIYPEAEVRGYKAIEDRVEEAYEEFVHRGGFIFTLSSAVQSHHNLVRFNWQMTPAAGGEVAATGSDCFVLSDDGRIRFDYQF